MKRVFARDLSTSHTLELSLGYSHLIQDRSLVNSKLHCMGNNWQSSVQTLSLNIFRLQLLDLCAIFKVFYSLNFRPDMVHNLSSLGGWGRRIWVRGWIFGGHCTSAVPRLTMITNSALCCPFLLEVWRMLSDKQALVRVYLVNFETSKLVL